MGNEYRAAGAACWSGRGDVLSTAESIGDPKRIERAKAYYDGFTHDMVHFLQILIDDPDESHSTVEIKRRTNWESGTPCRPAVGWLLCRLEMAFPDGFHPNPPDCQEPGVSQYWRLTDPEDAARLLRELLDERREGGAVSITPENAVRKHEQRCDAVLAKFARIILDDSGRRHAVQEVYKHGVGEHLVGHVGCDVLRRLEGGRAIRAAGLDLVPEDCKTDEPPEVTTYWVIRNRETLEKMAVHRYPG